MISRYKTLVSMHQDLMQSAHEGQEKIEHAKARLTRYLEEKDDEILQHNNELARLQMRFDRARSDVIIWVSAGAGLPGEARDAHAPRCAPARPLTCRHTSPARRLPRSLAGPTSRTPPPRRPSCLAPSRWRH